MVLAFGVAIGVLLGRLIARVMLSFLDIDERGESVVPPFVLQTDWRLLGFGVGLLAVVAVGTLTLAWLQAVRRPAASELRLTR